MTTVQRTDTSPFPLRSARALERDWRNRWRQYDIALLACRKKAGTARVHALRVASRRLLALLDLCEGIPRKSRARLKETLKQVLKKSAHLRDAQVDAKACATLRGKTELLSDVGVRLRKRAHKRAVKFARKVDHGLGSHRRPAKTDRSPGSTVAFQARVRATLEKSLAVCCGRLEESRTGGRRSRHRARLALKRHRYLLEAAYGNKSRELLAPFFAAQAAMGHRRDWERLMHHLAKGNSSTSPTKRSARTGAANKRLGVLVRDETRWRQQILGAHTQAA